MNSSLGRGGTLSMCVVCEEDPIKHSCKLCRAFLYCSKGCCKKDTKKHKVSCPAVAAFLVNRNKGGGTSCGPDDCELIMKHLAYLAATAGTKDKTDGDLAKIKKWSDLVRAETKTDDMKRADVATAKAGVAAARKQREETTAKVAAARAGVASAAVRVMNLKPESYSDSGYWEQRHAKSREGDETYEWYTGYPREALREAFPQSARDKKMLVVGCGNSELSEKMCNDGFRDVLSIDTSKSAIEQMSKRAPRFNTAQTKCRYEVMDAGHLSDLDTGTFGGVVDKGTIDAVLSGGLDMARRICREAMRVLEPGGNFLVVSNTPAEKLLETLLSMCGPESACDSPLAVPAVGGADPCVYAYIIRKKSLGSGKGKGIGVAYAGGQVDSAQRPGKLDESDAASVEACTAKGARRATVGDAAPRSDSHVSDLKPPVERRTPSTVDGSSDGRPRGGTVGGLPSSHLGHGRARTELDVVEMLELEALADKYLDETAAVVEILKQHRQQRGEILQKRAIGKSEGTARRPTADATSGAGGGGMRETKRQVMTSPGALRSMLPLKPILPEQQPSLPWGARECFSEDGSYATYELKFDRELSRSKLSVEIGATHVKACYRRQPDDLEVLLDRELYDTVTAESTWCIEDKTVLSFDFCKRTGNKWGRAFKNKVLKPFTVTGTGEKNANGSSVVDDGLHRKESRAVYGGGSLKPLPAPPAVPRKRERSPKVGLVTGHNLKAPEHFLLEDHVGIKKLQLHVSKPPGLKVTSFQVSRAGPEQCEVRFSCGDDGESGLPAARFRQLAHLGRADFDAELASCSDEAADGMCVVRIPYGMDHAAEHHWEEGEAGGGEADGEGVHHVTRLRCRFCKHPFTPAGRGLSVSMMPSGRWDECIEDMICFDGPQAVPMLAREVNFARPGRCLMAQVEVLLHPRDLIQGAVVVVDGSPATAAAERTASSMPVEPAEDLGWRSLECARCDLPLGRPATLVDGYDSSRAAEEDRGLLLLKHCLLGDGIGSDGETDDARDVKDGADAQNEASGGGGVESNTRGKGSASERLLAVDSSGAPPSPPPLSPPFPPRLARCVFENRTAIKWLMGEMAHYSERDGCARFIVSARGRRPAAPGGSLSLVLMKKNCLVSVDGGSKPGWAHRVWFREESCEEAERADEAERREEESEPSPAQGVATGGGGDGESGGKTAAEVPARMLEVSYAEYRAVRERLLGTAWASASTFKLDPRGYTYSWLF